MQFDSARSRLVAALKTYFSAAADARAPELPRAREVSVPPPSRESAGTAPSGVSVTVPTHMAYRRFLSDRPMAYEQAIGNAEAYVSRMPPSGRDWLHTKPYEGAPGNPEYFRLMYDLLNILRTMQLPPNARILEVGSGPGWITEILIKLGHEVDALEPSTDMIAVARERCAAIGPHFRFNGTDRVRFHTGTLEEVEFPAGVFDAVLFFDVLHHVIDEHVALRKTFDFLAPGGCVGVVEAAWHPDFKELESVLIKEMEEYGTLENPFSTEYLDHLLASSGFVDIVRYAGVNGFFASEQLQQPLQNFGPPLHGVNNLVARKPMGDSLPSCRNVNVKTDAKYTLISGGIDDALRSATLKVLVMNCGDTLWENRPDARTHVTLAFRRGTVGSADFLEAEKRHLLPVALRPGESVTVDLQFTFPQNAPLDGWALDAVAEGLYWFSSRGINGLSVSGIAH